VNHVSRPDSPAVADYTGVLRRRWWIVLAVTVLCLVAAVGYIATAPKAYSSTATVYVQPTSADIANQGSSSSKSGTVNLFTESEVVTSGVVASMAGKTLHSSLTPYKLAKQVSVSVPANSQTMQIKCTTSSKTGAAACANAFASAYLTHRSDNAKTAINQQVTPLKSQVDSLQKQEAKLEATVSGLPSNSSDRAAAQSQLSSVKGQLHSLNGKLAGLYGELAQTNGGSIITQALPAGSPSSPKKSLILPAGLIIGLLLGLVGAFVWDRRDKRLHNAGDVERLLGLPVLLSLPAKAYGRRVSLASARSRTGRAFTEMANNLAAALGEGSHIVLVAGASPGPAASVVAANLAASLARTHSEAVLVCAALRDSVAPELFGLADGRGLAEVLAGQSTVGAVARESASAPGLWVIPPGDDISPAEYTLQHDTARALTAQLRRDARFVIIEVEANGDEADTLALAEFADAAVLTVEVQRTTRPEGEAVIQRLGQMRTPLLGAAVLPPVRPGATVRPPKQQGQLRGGVRPGDRRRAVEEASGRGGAALGRGPMSSASGTGTGAGQGRDLVRPGRSADRYDGPTDRISGS
jgi:capsular polysaccharide biosynthesis protein/Mrp family chromosome partitioning ATPase